MEIDFTALDNISGESVQEAHSQPKHSHQLDKEIREREKLREIYHIQQENIRRAGTLRSEILKGIKRAEEPTALLLKALKCISLMTGDTAIYTQSKKDISAIYGRDLEEI